jgi:hypothetical protein
MPASHTVVLPIPASPRSTAARSSSSGASRSWTIAPSSSSLLTMCRAAEGTFSHCASPGARFKAPDLAATRATGTTSASWSHCRKALADFAGAANATDSVLLQRRPVRKRRTQARSEAASAQSWAAGGLAQAPALPGGRIAPVISIANASAPDDQGGAIRHTLMSIHQACRMQELPSGAYRDRTGDLRLAKPTLSQLS